MLKTMKYEFIRNKTTLIVLAAVMGGAEAIFLFGIATQRYKSVVTGITLLVIGASTVYFTIWLLGLISFGKDLRDKCGYMVFLTPVSPYKIVFAKLLVGLLELFATAILLILLASLDLSILSSKYHNQISILNTFSRAFGTTTDHIWGVFVVVVVSTMVSVLTLYSIAYLGASLATMMSRSKGGQKWISIGLVISILIVYTVVSRSLPSIDSHAHAIVVREFISRIPSLIFSVIVIIGCAYGTGYLVDKKISL